MKPVVKTEPATTYLVSSHHRATMAEIPHLAGSSLDPIAPAATAAGFKVTGPPVFFYNNLGHDDTQPFDFAMGFPVTGDATAPAPYELVTKPAFKCFAADYIGGMPGIKEGWVALFAALKADGHQPGGEVREIYKKWVDFESDENVTELQAGIE